MDLDGLTLCSVEDCARTVVVRSRGLCRTHNTARWRNENPEASREYQRQYRLAHPEIYRDAQRKHNLRTKYGLTPEEKEQMWLSQDKRCAICRTPIELWGMRNKGSHIDHAHDTGEVRGLLCFSCNTSLPRVEDAEWLQMAQAYLRMHSGNDS